MKKTALYDTHVALGAKIIPFAGYEMPVRYGSDLEEHQTVRNGVGIFDVSHMGEFVVKGPGALPLIQKVCSNDASKLQPGKVQYSCFPNQNGGIVDDLLVYMIRPEEYMLVVNASNIQKDWDWINSHNTFGAHLENISDNISLFAVQGPLATKVISKITRSDVASMEYYTFRKGNITSITEGAIISATGYTGAGGFEIYVYNEFAVEVWNAIMAAGEEFGIKPIGLGARDTLRLEMGYALYGNDIDDETSPIEAGLGWITKFSKDFINSANLLKQKEQGPARKLVGFVMEEKSIARHGYDILNDSNDKIGIVTSGTISPILGIGIGMGYVSAENASIGSQISISIRNRPMKARVVKMPFIQQRP
jgi:aminomethyltransferase